jgi:hypothetical protein
MTPLPECIKRTSDALAEGRRMERDVLEKIQDMRKERVDQVASLTVHVDTVATRVGILEEQVGGDMGIIKTMQLMQCTLQQMRDSLNKQAWLVPLATAAITTAVVAFVTKLM